MISKIITFFLWLVLIMQPVATPDLPDIELGHQYLPPDEFTPVRNEMQIRPGMVGRFIVPEGNINVAIFDPDLPNTSDMQTIVDKKDSASLLLDKMAKGEILADHKNQGFEGLKQLQEGDKAYIITDTNKYRLKVSKIYRNGHNVIHSLTDENYRIVNDDYPFMAYTCKECWQNIVIVGFERDK